MSDNGKTTESSRKEIMALKQKLRDLKDEREKWYGSRKDTGKNIAELIASIKEKRKVRNNLTDTVKENKVKRKKLNVEIRSKINRIKDLKEKHKDVLNVKDKVNPLKVKKEIERLMYKVETEGMTFANEQKMMKVIKDKQKELGQVKGSQDVFQEVRSLSKEIDALKKEADKFHHEVQQQASDSQRYHEEILEVSKEIDELKKEEKKSHNHYLKVKKNFQELNKEFKELMKKTGADSKEAEEEFDFEDDFDDDDDEPVKSKKSLKEQVETINEKIKSSGKLTTADLMLMQRAGAANKVTVESDDAEDEAEEKQE